MKTSCLIPCGSTDHLYQCLESLCPEFDEVLIYIDGDDQLKDEVFRIARPFNCNLFFGEGTERIGSNRGRNLLFTACTGDYVCFFDADDYRVPGALDGQIEYLRQNPEWSCVVGHLRFLWKDPFADNVYQENETPLYESIWAMLIHHSLQTGGMLWKREALEEIRQGYGDVFDPNQDRIHEYWLILRGLQMGMEIGIYPAYTHYYRWGWSDSQWTQQNMDGYGTRTLHFMDELAKIMPVDYLTLWQEEYDRCKELMRLVENNESPRRKQEADTSFNLAGF